MLVINGFFENGVFVPEKPLAHIKGRQRASLNIEETDKEQIDAKQTQREEGFRRFMQYQGTLPADFDYKKELADYRDELHGIAD
jgi:hypothetical protein